MSKQQITPTIIVHGGCGNITKSNPEEWHRGIQAAARVGYQVLCSPSGSALDAVEAAVRALEDDPVFNAGTGSTLTKDGHIEMDASIMEGSELRTGAVTCVQNIKNPVQLARMVMDKTDHILLAGAGANKFAKQMGVIEVPLETLVTEKRKEMLEHFKTFGPAISKDYSDDKGAGSLDSHDTVGAVAIDSNGNIACATSTGGITAKMPGRVGDSPLVGCGNYCDNLVGGVSTTGHGEAIARITLARTIIFHMEQGLSAQDAAEKSLRYMSDRVHSAAGAIVLDKHGGIGKYWTTKFMIWAYMKDGEVHYGLLPGEDFIG